MRTVTTVRSWRAIALAALFIAGTCYVLFQDLLDGAKLNTSHILTVLALIGATAAGHSCLPTWAEGRRILAAGLAVVAIAGLGYIVTMSGARNAETTAAKAGLIADNNTQRATLERDIAATKADLAALEKAAQAECAKGDGPLCKGKTKNAERTASHLRLQAASLALLKPAAAENAGYRHVALIWATLTGADIETTTDALVLVMPFVAVLITELGTVVFLGMGLGHKPRPVRAVASNGNEPPPAQRAPVKVPPQRQPQRAANVVDHPVLAALRQAGRPLSNDELAAAMGVTKGEASKRRKEVAGQVTAQRAGRHLMVAVR